MCCCMKNVILIFSFGEQNVIYVCFSSLTTTTELLWWRQCLRQWLQPSLSWVRQGRCQSLQSNTHFLPLNTKECVMMQDIALRKTRRWLDASRWHYCQSYAVVTCFLFSSPGRALLLTICQRRQSRYWRKLLVIWTWKSYCHVTGTQLLSGV